MHLDIIPIIGTEKQYFFKKKQDLKVYLQEKLQEPANLDIINVD